MNYGAPRQEKRNRRTKEGGDNAIPLARGADREKKVGPCQSFRSSSPISLSSLYLSISISRGGKGQTTTTITAAATK